MSMCNLEHCIVKYHRPCFIHKLKNPIIRTHRKIMREPMENTSSGFWRHGYSTLLCTINIFASQDKLLVMLLVYKLLLIKASARWTNVNVCIKWNDMLTVFYLFLYVCIYVCACTWVTLPKLHLFPSCLFHSPHACCSHSVVCAVVLESNNVRLMVVLMKTENIVTSVRRLLKINLPPCRKKRDWQTID